MRIQRKAITETVLPDIFLLERADERFLKWEKFVFWDEHDKLVDDFSARIPLSILLILFVLATSIFLVFQWSIYQVFATQGIPATEVLTMKDTTAIRAATVYYLTYCYAYGDEEYTINRDVSRSTYENAQEGASRQVLILPTNRDLMIESINEVFFPLLIALTLFVLASGLCVYYFYRWYRPILLLPAKITEVEQSEKHTNRGVHAIYEISYELLSPKTKKPLKGRTSIAVKEIAPNTEQLLAVLYVNDTDIIPL